MKPTSCPDLAAEFFGVSCSSRQFDTLLLDARREFQAVGAVRCRDVSPQRRRGATVPGAARGLRAPGASHGVGGTQRRGAWVAASRCEARWKSGRAALEAQPEAAGIAQCAARARALAADLERMLIEPEDPQAGGARSVAVNSRGFVLSLLPYDISARFRGAHRPASRAPGSLPQPRWRWPEISSISPRGSGSPMPRPCASRAPFDYERQALLYLPEGLPDPGAPDYTAAVIARGAAASRGERRRGVPAVHEPSRTADCRGPCCAQRTGPRPGRC